MRAKDILIVEDQEAAKQPERMASLLMDFLIDDDPMREHIADIPALIETVTLSDLNVAIRKRLPAFNDMVRVVTTANHNAAESDCLITAIADVDNC
ncbi:MAG: hypothetical protein GDA50_08530 [Alphaproteobacteria bacterium GM202ARS2]|nr:hypothetical protein [Alphaproteobacteria bacterium GM202ARS2]